MKNYFCKIAFIVTILSICPATGFAQKQLAFPTAEGYGKYTVGGRGGKVYEVTNLNDSGEGSLRAAVEAKGPRIVVFRVSGTIDADMTIANDFITIAGQTAPGDGITIKGQLGISANNVIIRYIRVRAEGRGDAISGRYNKNVIIDHVSASWSVDETMSIYHCANITVQWCLIAESMYNSNHSKGSHGYGGIWGSNYSTYHHNLIAHHSSRNPRFASGCGNTDFRNNVIYNWGYNSTYGGEKQQLNNRHFNFTNINMVANYYKAGPATKPGEVSYRIADPWSRKQAADYGKWYIADNVVHGNDTVTVNNWNGGVQPKDGSEFITEFKLDQPWPAMAINQQTAGQAYASVLEYAGATLPKRDAVDARIVDETRRGYATYEGPTYKQSNQVSDKSKKCGIIDSQKDVGGWPELKSTSAPTDTDHDGIPDEWEIQKGLNPNDASDGNKVADDGYTMLEKYLNSIGFSTPVNNIKNTHKPVSASEIPPMTAHFPLDEGKGLVVTDVIGGLNGTLINMDPATAWISGKLGGALHLDGANDRIFIPHNPAFDFAEESFSVSFLMRWPKDFSPSSEHIICKGDYTAGAPDQTGKRWELYIADHKNMTFVVDDDEVGSRLKVPIAPFITGDWVHVVMVRDTEQKQLKLYVNGVRQKSIDPDSFPSNGVDRTGSISNPQRLTFGDAYLCDNPMEGDLDDLRIFRLALTDEQIATIMSLSGTASPAAHAVAPKAKSNQKPRIIVTSDGEIDDQCSMIRSLLYANEWDIEGIITSSSQYHWQGHDWAGDDWIEPDLNAYEKVYPNLLKHEPGYPTPDYLRSITLLGNVKAEGEMEEVTAGSQHIMNVLLDETDNRPIWLQAWGGVNTIARALKTIQEEHPEKMETVANKIRLYLIWEQDATYQDYIKPNWGKYNILTIISDQFISYFYHWKKYLPENEQSYLVGSWMNENILKGHGPLCAEYKAHVEGAQKGFDDGDFRSEGDSPAFLHTILTGLRSMESPDWGGWGGRYVNIRSNTWLDPVLEPGYTYPEGRWYTSSAWGRERLRKNIPNDAELTEYLKPTWRWIEAIQKDFASRADWCVKSYENANHPPKVILGHAANLKVRPGAQVKLSAQGTSDPDGDDLNYRWWQYQEADSYYGTVEIQDAGKQEASFTVPNDAGEGITIHIVCEVTDSGTPPLTRYQRVVAEVK